MNNKWKDTVRLGKKLVCHKLSNYRIRYDHKLNYFKLCSLLYQHEQDTLGCDRCSEGRMRGFTIVLGIKPRR